MDPREAMRIAELAEAEFMYRMSIRADDASRSALGMAAARIGGGEVTVMSHDPTGGFWNRAIGQGITEPLTETVLDDVLAFARDHAAPSLVLQLAPDADPVSWPDLLGARGLQPSGLWVKFVGEASEVVNVGSVQTDLTVDVLDASHGQEFARVMCEGFGMPFDSPLPGWFGRLPGWGDEWTAYGAWDGERLVATATLMRFDDIACLAGAATLPSHRGRGAQGALMLRRVRDAASAGCRWISAETGQESEGHPNPSLHNMRRIGLTQLYERQNWIWRPPPR